MPGIYLYTGNRLEILADKLAAVLTSKPLSPLKREIILVQSRGMERWLALETAKRLNIWANCECPFPNTFIHTIYSLLLPDAWDTSHFDKELVTWHLLDILPGLEQNKHFKQVRNYLNADNNGFHAYQFAHVVADLFDQYSLYRPDMLLDWEYGTGDISAEQKWQSLLWVHLVKRLQKEKDEPVLHRANLLKLFQEKILTQEIEKEKLPERVSVFGISSLPPYHLQILSALAYHIDLHLFILNPCMEFWFDIVADRDIVKISKKKQTSQDKLHLEHGNNLLSSMGHQGRDFLAMVQDLDCHEQELFHDPGRETLLSSIQQDILYLQGKANLFQNFSLDREAIRRDDFSITFQSCHSPMREVEILHDQLLSFLDQSHETEPLEVRDILVMAPDINLYAPLIRAVFDVGTATGERLPYTISDQSLKETSKYIDSFFEILSLFKSRFTSIDVLGLLKTKQIRDRFSINDYDLLTLEKWLHETRICWGIDPEHKNSINLPEYAENTWRAGLDRLLLGYAMPGNNKLLFEDILPFDNIEGSNTKLLGSFLDFTSSLFNLAEVMQQQHTLAEWSEILLHLKADFLLPDEAAAADDMQLHHALLGLQELQSHTSFNKTLALDIVETSLIDSLEQRYETISGSAGFLSGSISFCSMLPMRSIPFKIICLLGMNDGLYPRPGSRKSFDLMSQEPRLGDRSRRYDDRYLFLETILSARNRLYISFEGQSVRDNSHKPPSVLVSELMDYIEQGYTLERPNDTSSDIIEHLTTHHRLQPFHPDYFRPPGINARSDLYSYSRENCEGAATLLLKPKTHEPVISAPLSPPPDSFKEISLDQLISFFSHPARFFLVKRIGMAAIEEIRSPVTSEPFAITGLDRYKLENQILEYLLAGKDSNNLYAIKKAAGILPHGKSGETNFNQLLAEVKKFKRTLDTLLSHQEIRHQEISLQLKDFKIQGHLKNLTDTIMVQYRYAAIKPKDVIRCWINHLALNYTGSHGGLGGSMNTCLVGKDRTYTFSKVANASLYLEELLALYWQGIAEPLHFFPRTSYAFAKTLHSGKDIQEALLKAQAEWAGNKYNTSGEKNDPYNSLCFRDFDLADSTFMNHAQKFFLPIFEHQA